MRLRASIAICVVMSPILCAAQLVRDENLPLCNPSQPNAGSVDIVTNTKGIDFGPYLESVKRKVKQRWYSLIPSGAMFKSGCVSVQFKILKNGNITDLHYKSTSGDPQLDRAASASIEWPEEVPPLPPLPPAFTDDHLELRFNFFYNSGPANGSAHPQTPALDGAALAPIPPLHGSTQDFARIADTVNPSHLNAPSSTPSESASTDIQLAPGRLVRKVDAQYPKEAKKSKLQGTVLLEATIGRDGTVINIAINDGNLLLADAAVDALRTWQFEPYTRNGSPIEVHQQLAFTFTPDKKIGELDQDLPPATLGNKSLSRRGQASAEGTYRIGNGVTSPKAIFAPDPDYSKGARKAKYQGTCVLSLIVGPDGQARDIKVTRAVGYGLDINAVESIKKWKFEPGMKDGTPVATYATIEVAFHLY
jgi:TonB family protein